MGFLARIKRWWQGEAPVVTSAVTPDATPPAVKETAPQGETLAAANEVPAAPPAAAQNEPDEPVVVAPVKEVAGVETVTDSAEVSPAAEVATPLPEVLLVPFELTPPEAPPAAVPTLGMLPPMRQCEVLCAHPGGLHRLAYTEWGDPANDKVLICVHGLTRNGRDFDFLAGRLADEYRVICPDVAGRGRSEWLGDKSLYGFPQYVADMVTLLARANVATVDWVGTSMGGLIGMFVASLDKSPIRRLVLNDVGPIITADSLKRIGEYVGAAPRFASFAQAVAYVRAVSVPFGPHSDEQWEHLTRYCVRETASGGWEMCYDPGIAQPFKAAFLVPDVNLWPVYDAIHCPTLAMRGVDSDLLMRKTWLEMASRGPHAQLVEVPGVGHAPTLMNDSQVSSIADFLRAA